jgi:hypothetical protein
MTHPENVIDEAKAVITSHEQFAKAGDLDAIMTNVADNNRATHVRTHARRRARAMAASAGVTA